MGGSHSQPDTLVLNWDFSKVVREKDVQVVSGVGSVVERDRDMVKPGITL